MLNKIIVPHLHFLGQIMSIHSASSALPLNRYKKMILVSKADEPNCLSRFKKNFKVYSNRFKYFFTHRSLITNKKMIKKIISQYKIEKASIKNGKGNIEVRKTDKVFKSIYKTTKDQILKNEYKKVRKEYKRELKKKNDKSSNGDSQSSSDKPANKNSENNHSNKKSEVDAKTIPQSILKSSTSKLNLPPPSVLPDLIKAEPLPSLIPDSEPLSIHDHQHVPGLVPLPAPEPVSNPKQDLIQDTPVSVKPLKKPAPKPKIKINAIKPKPERIKSKDQISDFEIWQTNNADYGYGLDGASLVDHFSNLLKLEANLKKSEMQEFKVVKESFVSSLEDCRALELYLAIEDEDIKNFLKEHNSALKVNLKGEPVSQKEPDLFLPSDIKEMTAYIDLLDFEELSHESVKEMFDSILEKCVNNSLDQSEWEALKAHFVAKLTASQAEEIIDMPAYECHEAFFICHNKAHENAAFKLMKEDTLRELAEAIQELGTDPLMTKFVLRLKVYAAKKREISTNSHNSVIAIFDTLKDPELEAELFNRLNEEQSEVVLKRRVFSKSWEDLILFAGYCKKNVTLLNFIASEKSIQGLTTTCAAKARDLLGNLENEFILRIKGQKELLDEVQLQELFPEQKVDSANDNSVEELNILSWAEAIAAQSRFKGIQASQGKELLASAKSLDGITSEQVTYIVTELFASDAALLLSFVKRLDGKWDDLLKNAPDQRFLLVNNKLFMDERARRGLQGLLEDLENFESSEKFCKTLISRFLLNNTMDGVSGEDSAQLYRSIIKFNAKNVEKKFFDDINMEQLDAVAAVMDNSDIISLIINSKIERSKKSKLLDLINIQDDEERKALFKGLRKTNEGITVHNSLSQLFYQKLISPEIENILSEDESATLTLINALQAEDSESNRDIIIKLLDVKTPEVRKAGVLLLSSLDAKYNFHFKEWLGIYKEMSRGELIQILSSHSLLENQAKAIAYILWQQTITLYDCNELLAASKSKYLIENIELIQSLDVPFAKAVALWFTKGNPRLDEFSLDSIRPEDIYALDVNTLYMIDEKKFSEMSVESLICVLRRAALMGNNLETAQIFLRVIKNGLTDKWADLSYSEAKFIYKQFFKYKSKLVSSFFKTFLLSINSEVFSEFLSKGTLKTSTPWKFLAELFENHFKSPIKNVIIEFVKIKLNNKEDLSKCLEMTKFLKNKLSEEEFAELFNNTI